jgi:hypothetical protein
MTGLLPFGESRQHSVKAVLVPNTFIIQGRYAGGYVSSWFLGWPTLPSLHEMLANISDFRTRNLFPNSHCFYWPSYGERMISYCMRGEMSNAFNSFSLSTTAMLVSRLRRCPSFCLSKKVKPFVVYTRRYFFIQVYCIPVGMWPLAVDWELAARLSNL